MNRTLSIQPTFQCNAACADCGTFSSPHDRTSLTADQIRLAIRDAKQAGFVNVVFTGGEATLRWSDLLDGIGYATELGLPTRLVSNAFWAKTPELADSKLKELLAAGLSEINFSTGDEHCRFVPIQRVVNAVRAAVRLGLRTHVMLELRTGTAISSESFRELVHVAGWDESRDRLFSCGESPWMSMDAGVPANVPIDGLANRDNVNERCGCDSVLQTYLVQADGRIGCCCGLGLRIIPELHVQDVRDGDSCIREAVEEAETDLIKWWIRMSGPEKILAWAAEHDPTIEWEGMYAHRCQACIRLYKDPKVAAVINEHFAEVEGEIVTAVGVDRFAQAVLGEYSKRILESPESAEPVPA